jgi:hypothetical protein
VKPASRRSCTSPVWSPRSPRAPRRSGRADLKLTPVRRAPAPR